MRSDRFYLRPVLLMAAIAALALLAGVSGGARATSYNMTMDFAVNDTSAGAHSNYSIELTIPGPDSIFSSLITFIPGAWGVGNCPADDPASASVTCGDDAIPDGAVVGDMESHPSLGLLNGTCNTPLVLPFELLDATTDQTTTVVFHDDPADDGTVGEQFEDDNGDGIPNGAQMYPDYLQRLIMDLPYGTPGAAPLEPFARWYGQSLVGGSWVSVQFLIFQPGITINGVPLDASLGFPSVFVLQNTGDPGQVAAPDTITDFCTPHNTTTTFFGMTEDNPATAADESGLTNLTNGTDGGYMWTAFVPSEYDADGDGIENPLDTCPFSGNPDGWDPRSPNTPGDDDGDGIANACDSVASDAGDLDQDTDTFQNKDDNCPLLANPDQLDLDQDDIGDACDPDPQTPTGHQHLACDWTEIDIGTGGDPAANPSTVMPCALVQHVIFGSVDCDNDVDAVDALFTLKFAANIQPPSDCIDLADVQCDGDKDSVDALQMLRYAAGLVPTQDAGCPAIGQ